MPDISLCNNTTKINGNNTDCEYWVTPYLRYAKKKIMVDEQTCKYELMLQQMWQGSDGSQKWEWIKTAEE